MLGDDLGAERYINSIARIDFTNVPYLKKYGVKPFVFGEYVFYPPAFSNVTDLREQIKTYSRGGIGFGIAIPLPIGDNLSIQIYHNAMIFNQRNKGDIGRASWINFDFGFY